MFKGTSIDELMRMVEQAEQHALALLDEARDLEMAAMHYEASQSESLAGVA